MMPNKEPLIVLTGPTASGKTSLSVKLAKQIDGQIISADSMQVYKYMDVGTAKITREEMDGVKHYLIDELEPSEEFNIAVFKQKSEKYIEEILSNIENPKIVKEKASSGEQAFTSKAFCMMLNLRIMIRIHLTGRSLLLTKKKMAHLCYTKC